MGEGRHAALVPGVDAASATCAEVEEAITAANRLGYPVVVKPLQSLQRSARRMMMMTTRYADDERALRESSFPSTGEQFTIQRCESGAVVSLSGVVADGALLGLRAARAGRMWPPRRAFTSASETTAPPPGVVERLERLPACLHSGWTGSSDARRRPVVSGPASATAGRRPKS